MHSAGILPSFGVPPQAQACCYAHSHTLRVTLVAPSSRARNRERERERAHTYEPERVLNRKERRARTRHFRSAVRSLTMRLPARGTYASRVSLMENYRRGDDFCLTSGWAPYGLWGYGERIGFFWIVDGVRY